MPERDSLTLAGQREPLRIAVLVKQIPVFDQWTLGADGRLDRSGGSEMNPFCRRAVAKAVELAAATHGSCTVFTLGPPAAEDVLREAIAWGADDGVLVCDPAFAGSDTLATATALSAALRQLGPFDLVLMGRSSVDADTGQVGPELAELLGFPYVDSVRSMTLLARLLTARCERDDGWRDVSVALPAVVSCAERLCEPAKAASEARERVPGESLRRLTAADLGSGPWGESASPTTVGEIRTIAVSRQRTVLTGDVAAQVERAVELLRLEPSFGLLLDRQPTLASGEVLVTDMSAELCVVVLDEPGQTRGTRELLGTGTHLAVAVGARVSVLTSDAGHDSDQLFTWGADDVVLCTDAAIEEVFADAIVRWARVEQPWAILAPSTSWGREVAGRIAAALAAGLVGDAIELSVEGGRLLAWKPAFGGSLVAAIRSRSAIQMATVRPGVLPLRTPRAATGSGARHSTIRGIRTSRLIVHDEARDDRVGDLLSAAAVLAVGRGVSHADVAMLEPLRAVLRAQIGATRKVTDEGWLPRARQIGVTGHAVSPLLYVAIGVSGSFNHTIGTHSAETVVAINNDPNAPIFDAADIGIVGDWREIVPALTDAITRLLEVGLPQ